LTRRQQSAAPIALICAIASGACHPSVAAQIRGYFARPGGSSWREAEPRRTLLNKHADQIVKKIDDGAETR
jgi:hypothetical protein